MTIAMGKRETEVAAKAQRRRFTAEYRLWRRDTAVNPSSIPAGSRVMIGAPATPMPREVSASIAQAVASVPGVLEAHLPQCFVPDVVGPAQILVVVLETGADREQALKDLAAALRIALPAGHGIDVWPLSLADELLADVRWARCAIFPQDEFEARASAPARRRWWQFWSS
jgi:hypothetical protein